jgi:putative peptidoglycan lipid II flippase
VAQAPRRSVGAAAVGAGILVSRLFGLVRQRAIGHYVGGGDAADVLSLAFRIPNALQNLLGEGVLSASFVPVYARLRAEGRDADAARLARAVFGGLAVVSAAVVLAGIAAAPWLVGLIGGGFTRDKQALATQLVAILFPGMGVLVLAACALGVLNAHRRYFAGYASPVAWNVAIIGVLMAQGGTADPSGAARLVAIGALVGSVLQLAAQVPSLVAVYPRGVRPAGPVGAECRTVLRNFAPVVLGRGVMQVSGWVDQAIAGYVTAGAAGVLFYAQNIALLPVSVFGMSVSVSELTEMAGQPRDAVASAIRTRLQAALPVIAYFVVPSSVAFIALGDVIAAAILQTGRFARADVMWVWAVLAGAGVGLVAGTMGRLYSSAWYALHDTRTPVRFAMVRVIIGAALAATGALWLPRAAGIDARWGVAAITVASGMAAWVEFALLRRALRARIGATPVPERGVARAWGAALLAAAVALGAKEVLPALHPIAVAAIVLTAYAVAYGTLAVALGVPYAAEAWHAVARRAGLRPGIQG